MTKIDLPDAPVGSVYFLQSQKFQPELPEGWIEHHREVEGWRPLRKMWVFLPVYDAPFTPVKDDNGLLYRYEPENHMK